MFGCFHIDQIDRTKAYSCISYDGKEIPFITNIMEEKGWLVFSGEIYNQKELQSYLRVRGIQIETKLVQELLCKGLLLEGIHFLKRVNGVYAAAFLHDGKKELLLIRDPFGVKPLFYMAKKDEIFFATSVQELFEKSGEKPMLTKRSICEVLSIGPAKISSSGIFDRVNEVKPGVVYQVTKRERKEIPFFKLEATPHVESYEETIEHTKELVENAVLGQCADGKKVCTLLSGGLDSSLVTAIVAKEYEKQGQQLETYSFEFVNNEKNFKSNAFQPDLDAKYVEKMVEKCNTKHKILYCDANELYEELEPAVDVRNYAGMSDVDSSLLHFCKALASENQIALTGECADEVFGGYPWYHNPKMLWADAFPWARDFSARTNLLRDEIVREYPLELFARMEYQKTLFEVPYLEEDDKETRRYRQMTYLNLYWFMQTLLVRMDTIGTATGLTARVPFADKALVQYVYNIPWAMKAKDGEVKGILKEVAKSYLPEEVIHRKKSPFPKTYDPMYETLVKQRVSEIVNNANSPLLKYYDKGKVEAYLQGKLPYDQPFYGQLMSGPQYLGYLIQLNYWLGKYSNF